MGDRPPLSAAAAAVAAFLADGDHGFTADEFVFAKDGANGWAFWPSWDPEQTTSYVHSDLHVEWLGAWREEEPPCAP